MARNALAATFMRTVHKHPLANRFSAGTAFSTACAVSSNPLHLTSSLPASFSSSDDLEAKYFSTQNAAIVACTAPVVPCSILHREMTSSLSSRLLLASPAAATAACFNASNSRSCHFSPASGSCLLPPSSPPTLFPATTHRLLSSAAAGSAVRELQEAAEFDDFLKIAADHGQLAVAYFTAKWCHPCKMIAPHVDQLSANASHASFAKIDIDEESFHDLLMKLKLQAVPTFMFFRGDKVLSTITGADLQKLTDTVNLLKDVK